MPSHNVVPGLLINVSLDLLYVLDYGVLLIAALLKRWFIGVKVKRASFPSVFNSLPFLYLLSFHCGSVINVWSRDTIE